MTRTTSWAFLVVAAVIGIGIASPSRPARRRPRPSARRTSAASTRRAPPAAMPTRPSTPGGAAPRAATTYPDVIASSITWPRTADMSSAETPVIATLARASPKTRSSALCDQSCRPATVPIAERRPIVPAARGVRKNLEQAQFP
jgi:hypothetical protein